MNIRLALPSDVARISALVRGLTVRYIAHEFPDEAATRLLDSMDEAAIGASLASGYRYHVAEENGDLAGVAAVRDNRHLYHLFVAEPYQRQGLARKLWNVAMAASLDAGNPGVFTVNSSRYAVGMYKKLGFVRLSEPIDRAGVICLPMKLQLAVNE